MRTKTIETIVDRGYWALVLIMPIVAYLILCVHFDTHNFIEILNQFYVNDSNVVYTTLAAIFGTGGYLEFFDTSNTNPILLYMAYFVCVELVHIIVDVLLFIPRLSVGILDKASQVGKI